MTAELEEQIAHVWTLQSQARVGSYQHECGSGPWMVLAGEQLHLQALLSQGLIKEGENG